MDSNDSPIKDLTSKKVFSAKLFDIDEVHITYTSGKEVVHHDINRRPTVSIFALTDNNELCLVNEYRYLLGKNVVAAPAGFMDKENESPLDTAKRELEEELGITASSWKELTTINIASSVIKGQSHLFLARGLTFGTARPEEGEMIQLVKLPIAQAVNKIISGEIAVAATIVGILLTDKLLQTNRI